MDLGIAGKVAFVAGGSMGMGRATAEIMAADGCRVAIVARSQGPLDETVDAIRAAGGTAMAVSADLGTVEGVERAVAAITARWDSPDIVVGQNTDMTGGDLDDTTNDDFERIFRTFTMSQVYLARATIPAMRKKKWGRYIHIGSAAGKEPQLSHPNVLHNTIRPSTVAFLRVLAHETAADGITVNVVGPGLTITPTLINYITDKMKITPEEGLDWLAGKPVAGIQNGQGNADLPMKRAARAEEIGSVVAFLASHNAGYLTGVFIAVDGGRHHFAF